METVSVVSLHSHCDTCIRRKCTVVTDPPCAVISCDAYCGAVFHECKLSEHRELCPLQKVPCLNVGSGCPLVLNRYDIRRHLSTCPASVVCCTMEWCRWPMYSRERGTRVPFAPSSLRARCGQLDVALALRDQRALDKAKKYPRRSVVRALRNPFTKHYPAVPLLVGGKPTFIGDQCESSFSESEGEDEQTSSRAPWLTAKEPPGLQRSILNELFCDPPKSGADGCVSSMVDEEVRCSLCSKSGSASLVNRPMRLPSVSTAESEEPGSCSCDNQGTASGFGNVCQQQSEQPLSPLTVASIETSATNTHVESPTSCGIYQTGAAPPSAQNGTVFKNADVQETGSQRVDDCTVVGHDDSLSVSLSPVTNGCGDGQVGDDGTNPKNSLSVDITSGPGCICPSGNGDSPCVADSSAPLPLMLHEVLAVDLSTEVCSRYHMRDPALYSFFCAQLFRRDEYARHVRDVHSVIHDAIDHWLEVRCPLAHSGCTFSMHRRLPHGAKIIFSPLLESLGLRRFSDSTQHFSGARKCSLKESRKVQNAIKEQTPDMFTSTEFDSAVSIRPRTRKESTPVGDEEMLCLTGLPFELLSRVASFLDSFSLCNLSLTCWLLRDVCRSLLKQRGIVVLEWQRDCSRSPPQWKISHKRWMFSTAFDSIEQYQFTDQPSMSEHLKECAFNVAHQWDDVDKVPLCQMADVVSTEKEMTRLHRCVWKSKTSTDAVPASNPSAVAD